MEKSLMSPFVTSIGIACAFASAALGQAWNPTTAFSVDHGNPNGPWSYGWYPSTLAGPLNLYATHTSPPTAPLWGAWIGGDSTPCIWKNTTGIAQYGIGIDQISLHPGPNGEASCIRWTNPQPSLRGTVLVTGQFLAGDWGTMQVGVRVNGSLAFSASDAGAFDLQLNNQSAQSVEFLVWGAYVSGNTPVITEVIFVPFCPGDFNQDGGVDGSDVDAFFTAWESGDSAADINQDGGVDGTDVESFFARWEAGC